VDSGLAGRVAIVTGAASGIGRATAQALLREGCRVAGVDADGDGLAGVAVEDPATWLPLEADISSEAGARAIVAETLRVFGALDVFVACAGVYETTSIDELTEELWDRVASVNVRGTFLCARAALDAMIPRGFGRIVTVSSLVADTGGVAAGTAYVASKASVVGLTRSLAHVAGPHGITVNCISPGIIDTPMTSAIDAETKRVLAERTPLRRNGRPEEVAAAILMLASDGASFIHGARLDVNGGLVMT